MPDDAAGRRHLLEGSRLRRQGDQHLGRGRRRPRAGWAKQPISLYGRNSASGTYGYFKEHALCKGDYKDTVKEQPGSASVVQGVTEDRFAIGYSGIGYKTSGVRAVPVAAKAGQCIDDSPENVISGKYPLSRFLYVYVNKAPNKPLDPLVREYLKYVLSQQGQHDRGQGRLHSAAGQDRRRGTGEAPVRAVTSRKRLIADRAARWVVSAGGIGVIASILGILIFILVEVAPLLFSARVEAGRKVTVPEVGKIEAVLSDEYRSHVATLDEHGVVRVVRMQDGKVVYKSDPMAPGIARRHRAAADACFRRLHVRRPGAAEEHGIRDLFQGPGAGGDAGRDAARLPRSRSAKASARRLRRRAAKAPSGRCCGSSSRKTGGVSSGVTTRSLPWKEIAEAHALDHHAAVGGGGGESVRLRRHGGGEQ